jgi:acetoacetate decarboxylase
MSQPRWPQRPTIDDIVAPGFSTPWDAPMVPPFPFSFRNAHVFTVSYRTSEAAIRSILPPPLEPISDIVLIHIYQMNDTDWTGPYGESNVMVGARLAGKDTVGDIVGGYSPYLFLSSDSGVAHGREVHGQPKKLGQPRIDFRGDLIVGTVARNGIDVVTATMAYKQMRGSLDDLRTASFDFRININLKAIDHIDAKPAIRQLTSRRLANIAIHECWAGPATVELRLNAQAPVHRLPVVEMLDGYFWVGDFTLQSGDVIHDYLGDGQRRG